MTRPRLLGLYSPHPGSGKSHIARTLLIAQGWSIISFAEPIKEMFISFMSSAGYDDAHIDDMLSTEKEARIPELGVSPRHMLQTLGVEWARECIGPNVWVHIWEERVTKALEAGRNVVCDDVRFPNEFAAVKLMGGEMWWVNRPTDRFATDQFVQTSHASEGALNNHEFDHRVLNEGTLADLEDLILNELAANPVEVKA